MDTKLKILLIAIILLAAFLRFYKLDWGNGFYFHPDENTVGVAVSQLSFPSQMHPHLYTYGSVVVYLIFFTKLIVQSLASIILDPLLIGRFYSAFFSTLAVLFFYLIGRHFLEQKWALLSAFFLALSPGLIQQAHYATPEPFLIFFLSLSLFFLLQYHQQKRLLPLIFASLFFGLALSTKISSVVFGLAFFLALLLTTIKKPLRFFAAGFVCLFVMTTVFAITSPFFFLDFNHYRDTYQYEGKVASGEIRVFYTRQFADTAPVVFQLENVFPFALGPILFLMGTIGLIVFTAMLVKEKNTKALLLLTVFFALFIPNALLFVKWTRYMAPVMPFFAFFAAFLLSRLARRASGLTNLLSLLIALPTIFWTIAFFSIYLQPDIRVQASNYIVNQIPAHSVISVEGANVVDIPMSGNFKIISLDFYSLDDNPTTRSTIVSALANSDYFIVQSRRVFMNHLRLPDLYPKTANFYQALFNNQLGFTEIKEFNAYPTLTYLGLNLSFADETAEETWSVFDHPVVRIFKKTTHKSQAELATYF